MQPSDSLRELGTVTARRALILTVARRKMIVDVGLIVANLIIAVCLEKCATQDIVTMIILESGPTIGNHTGEAQPNCEAPKATIMTNSSTPFSDHI